MTDTFFDWDGNMHSGLYCTYPMNICLVHFYYSNLFVCSMLWDRACSVPWALYGQHVYFVFSYAFLGLASTFSSRLVTHAQLR
jgi:hypothetical protein